MTAYVHIPDTWKSTSHVFITYDFLATCLLALVTAVS